MTKKNKTAETNADVTEFVNSFVDEKEKKADSFKLIELMKNWSGFEPKMWGPSIIGFGSYHYKYPTGHEGDAPILGFSPRKAAITLYVHSPTETAKQLLDDLGKVKVSKACIYVKKLADINIEKLEALCKDSIVYVKQHY
jgi:hypothetical protein